MLFRSVEYPESCLMKIAPKWLQWFLKHQNADAITLPPWGIFALPGHEESTVLAMHESVHWEQYKRMGFWRYYVTYLYYQLKYGYADNPMEAEARQAASQ